MKLRFLLLTLVALLSVQKTRSECLPPPEGLAAWWPADGFGLGALGTNHATLGAGTAYGPGVAGRAFVFDGTNGLVSTAQRMAAPQTFSLALWFKTDSTRGGSLIAFAEPKTGVPGYQDRQMYLGNDGRVHFLFAESFGIAGFFSVFHELASPPGFNDGQWHLAVSTFSTNSGRALYLDGVLRTNNPAPIRAESYNGWWRLGNGRIYGSPNLPDSGAFSGMIDEPMVFDRALGEGEVAALYAAGTDGLCVGEDPAPVFLRQPVSRTVHESYPVRFETAAMGSPRPALQWFFNDAPLAGETNAVLDFPDPAVARTGRYYAVANNGSGSVTGEVATLTVLAGQPSIVAWGRNDFGETNAPPDLTGVVQGFAGTGLSLALLGDGTVRAWGRGTYGQTNVPAGLSNVVRVEATVMGSVNYSEDVLALRADGTVVAWGRTNYGQANPLAGLSNVVSIAVGSGTALALRRDGTVAGLGTAVPTTLTNAARIWARHSLSAALRADSTLSVWGSSSYGVTNVPPGLNGVADLAIGGGHALALRSDGTVVAWGSNSYGQTNVPPDVTNAVAIAAGDYHSAALRADGRVTVWGRNSSGQTNVPVGLTNAVEIGSGLNYVVARRSDGTVVVWGDHSTGITNTPGSLTNVFSLSAGTRHAVALAGPITPFVTSPVFPREVLAGGSSTLSVDFVASGPVSLQWRLNGTNLAGANGRTLDLTSVSTAQAGDYTLVISNAAGVAASPPQKLSVVPFSFVENLASQNVLVGNPAVLGVDCRSELPLSYQWRFGGADLPGATNHPLVLTNVGYGQAGSYTVLVSNDAGSMLSAKGVVNVSAVAAWGGEAGARDAVPKAASNVVQVAAGELFGLALRADGTVVGWGGYRHYTETDVLVFPMEVPEGLSNAVSVSAGSGHGLALRDDGTVAAWGSNQDGQTNVPPGLADVVQAVAGDYHSLALRADGTVTGWGWDGYGQATVPEGLSNVVALGAGTVHSIAVKADGTVVVWGYWNNGTFVAPPGLGPVAAVAAANNHTLALRADGTVVGWGSNWSGQTNVPAGLERVESIDAGSAHNLALTAEGRVVGWGYGLGGQIDVPSWVFGVGSVSAGGDQSLAAVAQGPPFVTSRLADRVGFVGRSCIFRVEASGERPLRYQWTRNGAVLSGRTNAVLQLDALGLSDAGDYAVVVSNPFGSVSVPSARLAVEEEVVVKTPLQTALNEALDFATGGAADWFRVESPAHDGAGAARSGAVGNNRESILETTVEGPGTLSWWWKVSSEEDYDFLEVHLDGALQPGRISGEVDWRREFLPIPPGVHGVRWRYVKDSFDSAGQDAGWLDDVRFEPPTVFRFEAVSGVGPIQGDGYRLRLLGVEGSGFVVEGSSDLARWSALRTNSIRDGLSELEFPRGTNGQMFFRARSHP